MAGGLAEKRPGHFQEPSRDIPLVGDYDVAVVGAGPAGIAAAIAAARRGCRTLLLEKAASVGGVWTSGLVTCVMDGGKAALARELTARLDAMGARMPRQAKMLASNYLFEPEYMKLALEDMLTEANVDYVTSSPACAAYRDATGRRLETVVAESESGRQAYRARAFIDASGDGELGALARCSFDASGLNGSPEEQPASLCALVTVRDSTRIADCIVNDPSAFDSGGRPTGNRKKTLYRTVSSCGFEPSFARPALFRLNGNVLMLLSNHEYGLPLGDARAVAEATRRARRELIDMMAALSPIPLALMGLEDTRQAGVSFLRHFAGTCLAGIITLVTLVAFPVVLGGLDAASAGTGTAADSVVGGLSYALQYVAMCVLLIFSLSKSGSWARDALGG